MIDCHTHVGVELLAYLRNEFPYCQDLSTLLSAGSAQGVKRWVVFPMVSNLTMDLRALREGKVVSTDRLESVPYAFENRHLLREIQETSPEAAEKTYPLAIADPAREPEAQAETLRSLLNTYRFYGLKFQTTILQTPIRSLLKEGRVLLDLARDLDLALLIHTSVHPEDPYAQVDDVLDIVEKVPDIRFCLAHSLRFDGEALERLAALPNAWFDCSALRVHCQLAVEDSPIVAPPKRRFRSDFTRPTQVLHDLAEAYPDRLLWGSDAPYYSFVSETDFGTFQLRSTYADEAACAHALPDALHEKVTWENTFRWLGVAPPRTATPSPSP